MSTLWRPSSEKIDSTQIVDFAKYVGQHLDGQHFDYDQLWKWSIDFREEFWRSIWDFCEVVGEKGDVVLVNDKMPGAHWFPEAKLNFSENLLKRRDRGEALVFSGEDGQRLSLSYSELFEKVRCLQGALKRVGVVEGDRIAAYLPNAPEAIIGMLAASSLGAIWASCSPDFGSEGVIDRFSQIKPKVFISCTGYTYKGKKVAIQDKVEKIVSELPGLKEVVIVPCLNRENDSGDFLHFKGLSASFFNEFLQSGKHNSLTFSQLPFSHPLYIMFSSGTTGKPKCMVHSQGGTLLQHLKEHRLHCNLRRDDRIFYFTTTGWMMWNWLVTSLASEATLILYDGHPFYPHHMAMFELIERERINVFGTSAKYLDVCRKESLSPSQEYNFSSLRTVLSTGSPLLAESFDWVYQEVKEDICLSSITGGTDLISCFALGVPTEAVVRGEIQKRGLGMAVQIYDKEGISLEGEAGELVCTRSFPSMPTHFWDDRDGSKYYSAYFDFYSGVWRHGDWAELTDVGGIIMYGRSDTTLNPGGVRIGTAEIYRQIEEFPEILESVVVGRQCSDGDQEIVLFVVLKEGGVLDDDLKKQICSVLRNKVSPRHVPREIKSVPDVPRTRSGKISEVAVREAIHGREVSNLEALANPESIKHFVD